MSGKGALPLSDWYSARVGPHTAGMTVAARCPCSHTQPRTDEKVRNQWRSFTVCAPEGSHTTAGEHKPAVDPEANGTTSGEREVLPWGRDTATPGEHDTVLRECRNLPHPPLLVLVLLLLLTRPLLPAVAQERMITCECSTVDCVAAGVSTCSTAARCYSQLLNLHDGSQPVIRGCITASGTNSLLCMNHRPAVHHKSWPYLVCCDTDLCNRDVAPIPPPDFTTRDKEFDALRLLGVSSIGEFREKYENVNPGGDPECLNTLYLAVIGAALALMITISAAGVCLLSRYRSKYSRTPHVSFDVGMEKLKPLPMEPSAPPLLSA